MRADEPLLEHGSWGTRYADATGFGQSLQPGRNIHAVAVNIVVLRDNDVAQIDAYAEYDALIDRHVGIALGHPKLHRHCAGDCLDDARKFDQDSVPGRLDDTAPVFGDLRINQFTAMRSEPSEGVGFVLAHESAVSDDIGGKNGREPTLDPLSAQCFPPAATRR